MRVPVDAERHTSGMLVRFHSAGGGVLLRCLIILFVIVPFLAPEARAGKPTDAAGPGLDLVPIGAASEVEDLISLVPEADRQEVRSAAARVVARTKTHGGDWEISYSKNGRFRLVKTVIPGNPKDEVGFVKGVLLDEDGREVAHWPRMYKDVFISNTGRNLVAAEMTWGTGFDFYDLGHTEPVNSVRRHIADGRFSDDGRFFVALSAGIALFTAEGESLWSRSIKGGRGVSISPDGEYIVLADGRPAGAGKLPPEAMSGSAAPITVFSAGGDVLLVYDTQLYRIDEVTFADDGRRFAVVGTNELLLLESDSGTLLKRIVIGPAWDDIADVAFSPDGRYLVAAITRYPTTENPARPPEHRYELWDVQDFTSGAAREDEAPTLRIARVIEVTDGSTIYAEPVWSPDGSKLAFSLEPQFGGLYIRNADGSGPIQEITSDDIDSYHSWWERPSSLEVRLERDFKNRGMWIVEGDGTKRLEFPYEVRLASLSPTGDRVAFMRSDVNLCVSHLDGSSLRAFGYGLCWDWSPDGSRLCYMSDIRDGEGTMIAADLFIADVETGVVTRLTNTPDVVEMFPRWSPEGMRIAYSTHRAGKICVAILEEVR
jgi:dipeptidyl aminopeptidase/acylaminoacyl peptidase